MSIDLDIKLQTFFASAPQTKRIIQTLQISHSSMTATRYLWREPYVGSITLEDTSVVSVSPLNMEIEVSSDDKTLDQVFNITLDTVDINDELRDELDLIPVNTSEKIAVVYREYLSDDLTDPLAIQALQVESIAYSIGAAKLAAITPRLNVTRTGRMYSYKLFPLLRGFV